MEQKIFLKKDIDINFLTYYNNLRLKVDGSLKKYCCEIDRRRLRIHNVSFG